MGKRKIGAKAKKWATAAVTAVGDTAADIAAARAATKKANRKDALEFADRYLEFRTDVAPYRTDAAKVIVPEAAEALTSYLSGGVTGTSQEISEFLMGIAGAVGAAGGEPAPAPAATGGIMDWVEQNQVAAALGFGLVVYLLVKK